jgi:hypothetical protein
VPESAAWFSAINSEQALQTAWTEIAFIVALSALRRSRLVPSR